MQLFPRQLLTFIPTCKHVNKADELTAPGSDGFFSTCSRAGLLALCRADAVAVSNEGIDHTNQNSEDL